MMEGLLDFGIAGLKKGLRFTGLSDDSQVSTVMYISFAIVFLWNKGKQTVSDYRRP